MCVVCVCGKNNQIVNPVIVFYAGCACFPISPDPAAKCVLPPRSHGNGSTWHQPDPGNAADDEGDPGNDAHAEGDPGNAVESDIENAANAGVI